MGKGTITREAGLLTIFSFVMIILGGQNLLTSIPLISRGEVGGVPGSPEQDEFFHHRFNGGLWTTTAIIEVVTGVYTLMMAVLYLATGKAQPQLTQFSIFLQLLNWFQYCIWNIVEPSFKLARLTNETVPHPAFSVYDYKGLGAVGIIATCAYTAALQLQLMFETIEFHAANNHKPSPLPTKWIAFLMNFILLWGSVAMIAFECRVYALTIDYRCILPNSFITSNCQKLDPPLFISPAVTTYPALPLVAALCQCLLAIWGLFRVLTVSESAEDGGFSVFGPVTMLVFLITLGLHVYPSLGATTTYNFFLGWNLSAFVPFILSVAIWDAKYVVDLTQDEHDFQ